MFSCQRMPGCRLITTLWVCVYVQCLTLPVGAEQSLPVNPETANSDLVEIRLVFGSFAEADNARVFAAELSAVWPRAIEVLENHSVESTNFRVVGPPADAATIAGWSADAQALGLEPWRLIRSIVEADSQTELSPIAAASAIVAAPTPQPTPQPTPPPTPPPTPLPAEAQAGAEAPDAESARRAPFDHFNFDLDLGVQNRLFAHRGSNTSDRAQQSLSAQFSASTEFSGGANLLALDVFGRWDSDDAQRSHTDLRELSLTHIADRWQVQAGVGQVFWGVVEFNHLIDVVNQTDLVENPDGEEKLGQPMVTFTALPDWGSVELFVLPSFRTRTLPGISGRLSFALPIDRGAAEFESGAGRNRVDGLLRVSTQLGGVLFDVYHFNGTRRTPRFEAAERPVGSGTELFLIPNYDTVKQTAVAAQANAGDTAFKLEALQQDGGPESYWAAAVGVEHTFVGVLGGVADLGAVVEYHYDSRGGSGAFDSFFENDLALGARFAANDINDTQALLGVVWDTRAQEWIVQLEASRRLSDRWSLAFETRWFAGGEPLGSDASLADLLDPKNKLGSVQRDDYLQLEFTRFF